MKRITVDISDDAYIELNARKTNSGSSISFEANALIVWAINEKKRKKKTRTELSKHVGGGI
jgi:hypothetical protein